MPLIDPPIADAIRGDLEEERRRRATRSPIAARVWFWRAWVGIRCSAALRAAAEVAAAGKPSGWLGPAHDWRQAARGLRRAPWYAASGIGVIALSLTLTTTVFAVVDGIVFRPLPYARPDRLVSLRGGFKALPETTLVLASWPDVRAWTAAAPTVDFATMSLGELTPIGDADALRTAEIDARFLPLLGIDPLMGGFSASDFTPAVRTAMVVPALVSYATWQSRFGGDPSVIGTVRTDSSGHGLRVVGVLPASFVFPTSIALFVPEVLTPFVPGRSVDNPTAREAAVFARLPPGLSPDALARRLTEATAVVARTFPPVPSDPRISPRGRIVRGAFDRVVVRTLGDELTTGTRPVALAVFATAAGLLLLASLNLIGLSTSRLLDRRPEIALRRALGGTTASIVRLVAIEHALLVLGGGVVGLASSPAAVSIAARLLPQGVVLFKPVMLDVRVAAFAAVAMITALVIVTVGIAIAMPRRLTQTTGRTTDSARSAGRSVLVTGQVALALVMTVSGALLASSLIRIWTAPVGWHVEAAARLRVRGPQALDLARLDAFLDRLRLMPGVAHAGALDRAILERGIYGSAFDEPVGAGKSDADVTSLGVTADFFDAAGLPLVAGRLPTRDELTSGASVAVISQRLAGLYWRGRPAIGQTLRRSEDGRVFGVIGVVPEARTVSWDLESGGEIYVPLAATRRPSVANIIVRFHPGRESAFADVMAAATSNEAGLRVLRADTLSNALGESIDWRRFQAWLFVTLGAAALAIVGVGVLGLMAMRTGRRTREVGVRMALGATGAHVRRQLMTEQFLPVAAGLVIGSGAAIWISTVLRTYLYKPPAYDWSAWTAAVALIIAAALTGISIPAWKASRVDPVAALRQD